MIHIIVFNNNVTLNIILIIRKDLVLFYSQYQCKNITMIYFNGNTIVIIIITIITSIIDYIVLNSNRIYCNVHKRKDGQK